MVPLVCHGDVLLSHDLLHESGPVTIFDAFQILQLDYSDREQVYRENYFYVDQYVPLLY